MDDILIVPLCELEYRQRIGYIEIAQAAYSVAASA